MICDVGTRLYTRQEERWQLDPVYRHRLQERLGAESIQAAVCSVAIPQGVALQEADRQSDFKCSYYTEPTVNVHAVLEDLQRQFEKQHVHVTPVFSVDPVKHCGLLDILPRGVGKDFGLQYLAEVFGLSHDRLLFSGDSGNDMRGFVSGFSAIVVGNASESVKLQVQNAAAKDRNVRAYISQACLVEGVLEGLQHYGVLLN
jgi:hydroxymethylpyrimidine pyrophosphatase-like HAD family hydrolase